MAATDELTRLTSGIELMEDEVVDVSAPDPIHPVIADLQDVAFKLRAFMESTEGDFGLGVETGMQRAADMIDNLIRRHANSSEGAVLLG